ncbi:MAG: hypothetical protein WC880_04315 [Candidatus Paceibacterota bacterium]
MLEAWLNFTIVVFMQLLLFIIHAYYAKKLSDVPRILLWGALIGIVIGMLFDLVLGKFFGLHSYTLGFGLFFLSLNVALSYGLFAANILLMQYVRLPYFFLSIIIVMAVYEITNHFFRVWAWNFVLPRFEFLMVLLAGYFGGAILVAIISHVFLGHRFFFISNLLKK